MNSKTKPWAHQTRAYDFAYDKHGVLLALEMGCGKSKIAVDLCVNRQHRRVLIAAPLSVLNVWPREFSAHAAVPYDVLVLNKGTVLQKQATAAEHVALSTARQRPCAVVINHESLWRDPFGKWAMLGAGFDCAIIDESHRAKSHKGRLGRYLMNLGKRIDYRMMLTGTPAPHSLLDLFAQFRFIDPSVYGWTFFPYKSDYTVMGGFKGKQVVAFKNLDTLNKKFHSRAFVVKKKDALDLPEELKVNRTCTLSPKAQKAYADLENSFYAELETGEVTALNALTKLLRLQQVTSGFLKLDDGTIEHLDTEKRDLLKDILEDLQEPVIVFCRFTEDLRRVQQVTHELGRRYGEVSGARKDLTDEAKMPDNVDIMGVQIQSGGVGVDFTRAATAIYYSLGFNLADYLQSQSRLHRPGQKKNVTYIHLLAEGTIDERVAHILHRREHVINNILAERGERRAA